MGCGFPLLALRTLLAEQDKPGRGLAARRPHHRARARRIIFLFMHGGPSHLDTFDPKPRLAAEHGKPIPFERGLTFGEDAVRGLFGSPWRFRQHGESGIAVSELFPEVARCADDLCVIRSMVGDGVDHGAALLQLHTGVFSFKRPSMGSWLLYGLGTENENLPGYVTIKPTLGHGGQSNWSSAFLPAEYQGTPIGHSGSKLEDIGREPIPWLAARGVETEQQRYELEMLGKMNRAHAAANDNDPELEARIQAFELSFRMQAEAPEAFAVESETEATRRLYGLDDAETRDFGWQCLLARRLTERGVRMVQCYHSYWDQHAELVKMHTRLARQVDKPIAGLLKDLKARGLFSDTLVIWAGEFGRTPWAQGADGRDHNPYGYTIWMAGAGVKPGFIYGATDEFGYHAVENRMHIHDLHATILHLMGLDHLKLTFRQGGRDFRLTDVAGQVHEGILS
jgi:hypothetical protein